MIAAPLLLAALAAGAAIATPSPKSPAPPERTTMLPPGSAPRSPELALKLESALAARAQGYRPRTRHLLPDGRPRYANRLLLETSPYLQQHAHNPVDWWPWGEEAFAAARARGVPVLLSIGYSTCHWCHVMEEESFEDEEIATELNRGFVAIKVDREERPDVDGIYMSAVQAMTGGGGWPMNVWLTHDRVPFFGGTYFPPRDGARGRAPGFLTLLRRLREAWTSDRARVEETAARMLAAIREAAAAPPPAGLPRIPTLDRAASAFASEYDARHGGRLGAPKFPATFPVRFLLRHWARKGDPQALEMAAATLEKMAAGGIYDQVGRGFHRYATDEEWLVPHFEKMLYDNALLVVAYLEGFAATGNADFARIARETLAWMEEEMRSPEGGFYSATDADSIGPGGEREEGYYFSWTPAELEAALGPERAALASAAWGVSARGNFEGRNILRRVSSVPDLDAIRKTLRGFRSQRPAPLRDDKRLTAWNGLAISAFARAGLTLGDARATEIASSAASFVLDRLRRNGRLLRSFQDGRASHAGTLDDYAFVIAGLLDLFEATGAPRWLEAALELEQVIARHFEDARAGGFYFTADDAERLLAREKPAWDGAEPSGNSVHALNLLRLGSLTAKGVYRERAERTLRAFGKLVEERPQALSEMLLAADYWLAEAREIVLVAPGSRSELEPFLARLRARFVANRVLIQTVAGSEAQALDRVTPLASGKIARGGKATAYLCRQGVCELPVTDPDAFDEQLRKTAIDRPKPAR